MSYFSVDVSMHQHGGAGSGGEDGRRNEANSS